MHSNVTIKNVSWLHFIWPTLYTEKQNNLQLTFGCLLEHNASKNAEHADQDVNF